MLRTLVIANQKGGIGKSTAAANIGRALSEKGKRVLLVDLDPQGGLSASFDVSSFEVKRSTYSLLMNPATPLAKILRPVAHFLALLPASLDLSTAEVVLATKPDGVTRLRDALSRLTLPFDFILIDTPPTLGVLTANGLTAASELLIPIQCQYLAMRGVNSLIQTVERLQNTGLNPDLKLTGVFATMYHPGSEHSREAVEEMRAVFGEQMFSTLIEYDPLVGEAPAAGIPLLDYAPDHPISQSYRSLAEEILQNG